MGNKQTFRLARKAAYRLAGWQFAVTATLAAAAAWLGGISAAVSVLTGGGIGLLAGLYQALRMLRVDASENPQGFARGVFVSEAMKIVLTVALLIAAIRVLRVELVPTMVGYIAALTVYWVALGTKFPWFGDTKHASDRDDG